MPAVLPSPHASWQAAALALLALAGCHTDAGPGAPSSPGPASTSPAATTARAPGARPSDPDDAMWEDARGAGMGNGAGACAGVGPVKDYLARYPKGKHADEARKLLPDYERSCQDLQSGIAKATPWVDRQKDRQASFLAVQECAAGCKDDSLCRDHCGRPPVSKARCAPCTFSGRCQLLTDGASPAELDCCLPITDDSGCVKAKKP